MDYDALLTKAQHVCAEKLTDNAYETLDWNIYPEGIFVYYPFRVTLEVLRRIIIEEIPEAQATMQDLQTLRIYYR